MREGVLFARHAQRAILPKEAMGTLLAYINARSLALATSRKTAAGMAHPFSTTYL